MTDIQIAQQVDLEGINNIRKEVRDDKKDPHTIKDFMLDDILEKDYQTTIISKDQNCITGFLNIHKYHWNDKKTVGIIELFVKGTHRGKGLGQELIKYIIQYCRNTNKYNEITLSVLNDNNAIDLYTKCGFIITKKDTDCIWMLLKI
ncbi:Acetyltransferase (GNAT) family protein [Candidatus Electrothrix aarhusensis]|uniref:Acetyltransferase (GNAT) family protein n=1 Tax=Candidatus Electrothrix aarhusensis TaxID=1859131 RepID=A0A3S4TB59_9BACT|nr:Acetyltransferase (GNAT) family protein [Candidatus Electrothrix aarhusensis]